MLAAKPATLRPPLPSDETFLVRLRNYFQTQSLLLALPRANSARRVGEWIHAVLNDPHSVFFIVDVAGAPAGFVQIRQMDFVHGTGELGIFIDARARGRGVAATALRLLERYVVRTFRLRKVILRVRADNARAIAFYRKCGYRAVGVHRRHFYHAGRYHDVAVMEHLL